ncbi:MAG TPA: OpgC domain-containing protein [Methylovirgula sp.]
MRWLSVPVRYCSMLGRHSLIVFCVGSLLSLIGQIVRFAYGGALLTDTLMVSAGVVIMGIVAWLPEQRDGVRKAVSIKPLPTS